MITLVHSDFCLDVLESRYHLAFNNVSFNNFYIAGVSDTGPIGRSTSSQSTNNSGVLNQTIVRDYSSGSVSSQFEYSASFSSSILSIDASSKQSYTGNNFNTFNQSMTTIQFDVTEKTSIQTFSVDRILSVNVNPSIIVLNTTTSNSVRVYQYKNYVIELPDPGKYQIKIHTGFSLDSGLKGTVGSLVGSAHLKLRFQDEHTEINGSAFEDDNLNGIKDLSEKYLGGIGVYIDINLNGKYDTGDLTVQATSYDQSNLGSFSFKNLPLGKYRIRPVPNGLKTLTTKEFYDVTVSHPNQIINMPSFGIINDVGNTINNAYSFNKLSSPRLKIEPISYARDIDLYSFTADKDQLIAIDLDIANTGNALDSYLRLFASNGNELVKNDDPSLQPARDLENYGLGIWLKSAYIEYRIPATGTYYFSVSAHGNSSFNPITGAGSMNAGTGGYLLTVYPVTNTLPISANSTFIRGQLFLPNPVNHIASTPALLSRVSSDNVVRPIQANIKTWVVIHGRQSSSQSANISELAKTLDGYQSGDQVLTLDWMPGANDNIPKDTGLQGSVWVPIVGQWAAYALQNFGISGENIRLVGHSWGTYVAYEISKAFNEISKTSSGGVKNIIALDPAYHGVGANLQYDATNVNFSKYSKWSWSFYGNGLFGSNDLAGSADESFELTYKNVTSPVLDSLFNKGQKHDAPVALFTAILNRLKSGFSSQIASLFSLSKLEAKTTIEPWMSGKYDTYFEGKFLIDNTNGTPRWGDEWPEVRTFVYIDKSGKTQIMTT